MGCRLTVPWIVLLRGSVEDGRGLLLLRRHELPLGGAVGGQGLLHGR